MLLRVVVPAGFMPSSLSEGWYLALCPDGVPVAWMVEFLGHDHHGSAATAAPALDAVSSGHSHHAPHAHHGHHDQHEMSMGAAAAVDADTAAAESHSDATIVAEVAASMADCDFASGVASADLSAGLQTLASVAIAATAVIDSSRQLALPRPWRRFLARAPPPFLPN